MKQYDTFWGMNNCIKRTSGKRYVWYLAFVCFWCATLARWITGWLTNANIEQVLYKYINLFLIFPDGINLPLLYSHLTFILNNKGEKKFGGHKLVSVVK